MRTSRLALAAAAIVLGSLTAPAATAAPPLTEAQLEEITAGAPEKQYLLKRTSVPVHEHEAACPGCYLIDFENATMKVPEAKKTYPRTTQITIGADPVCRLGCTAVTTAVRVK